MTKQNSWRFALAAVVLAGPLAACGELNIENPNAPERERAFSDPATIVASAAGTLKTWVNTRWAYDPALTMSAMADSYTASWNNFNMRYYSSYGVDCPNRCAWVNSTATQLGIEVQGYWYGMYSAISSANDALFAIRLASPKPNLGAAAGSTEVLAQLTQAASHAFLALNYDRAFIVEEDADTPEELAALQLSTRAQVRDRAIAQFEKGITLAKAATPFTTDINAFGGQFTYSGRQLAKVMRTLQAETLALWPRTSEENAQVVWSKVAEYASQGISSTVDGAAFDWNAYTTESSWNDGGVSGFFSGIHQWGNDYTTVRVDTRMARLLSSTQKDPWPGGVGSLQPADAAGNPIGGVYGVDLRLGDGCYGEEDMFGVGECEPTALSGTDFMWSPVAIMNPTRGQFHQSNIGRIREHCLVGGFPDCPTGAGPIPLFTRAHNDLLWAEGLIRGNGDKALAATLINKSRVTRGGLAPVTAANTTAELLAALIYEQEVEQMHIAFVMYANRRRETRASGAVDPPAYNNLWPETPRQMPIPAKDLQLLKLEIYTFGGASNPAGLSPGVNSMENVRNVRQIWAEMQKRARQDSRRRQ